MNTHEIGLELIALVCAVVPTLLWFMFVIYVAINLEETFYGLLTIIIGIMLPILLLGIYLL